MSNFLFLLLMSANSIILLVYCKNIPSESDANYDADNLKFQIAPSNVADAQNLSQQIPIMQQIKNPQNKYIKKVLKKGELVQEILKSIVEIFRDEFEEACCFEDVNFDIIKTQKLFDILRRSLLYYNTFVVNSKELNDYKILSKELNKLKNDYKRTCELEYSKCMYKNENFNLRKRFFGFIILIQSMISKSIDDIKSQQLNTEDDNLDLSFLKQNSKTALDAMMKIMMMMRNISSTSLEKFNRYLIQTQMNSEFNDVKITFNISMDILTAYKAIFQLYKNLVSCYLASNYDEKINELNDRFLNFINFVHPTIEFLNSLRSIDSQWFNLNKPKLLTMIQNIKIDFNEKQKNFKNFPCTENSHVISNDGYKFVKYLDKCFQFFYETIINYNEFVNDMPELVYYQDLARSKSQDQIFNIIELLEDNVQKIVPGTNNLSKQADEMKDLYYELKNLHLLGYKKHVFNIFENYFKYLRVMTVNYQQKCNDSNKSLKNLKMKTIPNIIEVASSIQKLVQKDDEEIVLPFDNKSSIQMLKIYEDINTNNLIPNCQIPNDQLLMEQESRDNERIVNILDGIERNYQMIIHQYKRELDINPDDNNNLDTVLTSMISSMTTVKMNLQSYSSESSEAIIQNLISISNEIKHLRIVSYEKPMQQKIPNETEMLKLIDDRFLKQLKIAVDFFQMIVDCYKHSNEIPDKDSKIVESNVWNFINLTSDSVKNFTFSHFHDYRFPTDIPINRTEEMLKLIPIKCGPQNKKNYKLMKTFLNIFKLYYYNFPRTFDSDDYSDCYLRNIYEFSTVRNSLLMFDFQNSFNDRTPLETEVKSNIQNIRNCLQSKPKLGNDTIEIAEIVNQITEMSHEVIENLYHHIVCNASNNNVSFNEIYKASLNSLSNLHKGLEILKKALNEETVHKNESWVGEALELFETQRPYSKIAKPCNTENLPIEIVVAGDMDNVAGPQFGNYLINVSKFLINTTSIVSNTVHRNGINSNEKLEKTIRTAETFADELRAIIKDILVPDTNTTPEANIIALTTEGPTNAKEETLSSSQITEEPTIYNTSGIIPTFEMTTTTEKVSSTIENTEEVTADDTSEPSDNTTSEPITEAIQSTIGTNETSITTTITEGPILSVTSESGTDDLLQTTTESKELLITSTEEPNVSSTLEPVSNTTIEATTATGTVVSTTTEKLDANNTLEPKTNATLPLQPTTASEETLLMATSTVIPNLSSTLEQNTISATFKPALATEQTPLIEEPIVSSTLENDTTINETPSTPAEEPNLLSSLEPGTSTTLEAPNTTEEALPMTGKKVNVTNVLEPDSNTKFEPDASRKETPLTTIKGEPTVSEKLEPNDNTTLDTTTTTTTTTTGETLLTTTVKSDVANMLEPGASNTLEPKTKSNETMLETTTTTENILSTATSTEKAAEDVTLESDANTSSEPTTTTEISSTPTENQNFLSSLESDTAIKPDIEKEATPLPTAIAEDLTVFRELELGNNNNNTLETTTIEKIPSTTTNTETAAVDNTLEPDNNTTSESTTTTKEIPSSTEKADLSNTLEPGTSTTLQSTTIREEVLQTAENLTVTNSLEQGMDSKLEPDTPTEETPATPTITEETTVPSTLMPDINTTLEPTTPTEETPVSTTVIEDQIAFSTPEDNTIAKLDTTNLEKDHSTTTNTKAAADDTLTSGTNTESEPTTTIEETLLTPEEKSNLLNSLESGTSTALEAVNTAEEALPTTATTTEKVNVTNVLEPDSNIKFEPDASTKETPFNTIKEEPIVSEKLEPDNNKTLDPTTATTITKETLSTTTEKSNVSTTLELDASNTSEPKTTSNETPLTTTIIEQQNASSTLESDNTTILETTTTTEKISSTPTNTEEVAEAVALDSGANTLSELTTTTKESNEITADETNVSATLDLGNSNPTTATEENPLSTIAKESTASTAISSNAAIALDATSTVEETPSTTTSTKETAVEVTEKTPLKIPNTEEAADE